MQTFKKWTMFFTASAVSVIAAPSDPTPFSFTQEDGTVVSIQEFGDEYYNFSQTVDGYLIVGDGNGSYVYADAEGKPSKFLAKNADERTEEENAFLKTLNQSEVRSKHRTLNGDRFPETKPQAVKKSPVMYSPGNKDAASYVKGERFFPVLLISTADFAGFDSTLFARMFNEEGYKEDGHYGSLRDYFISSSGGQFQPTFDVYPIKLPQNFGSYKSEGSLITAALDLLVERSDFKARADKYEKVSPFIFMHPLSNDKAKTYNSGYFSHQYQLKYSAGKSYSKNGYQFDNYAFVAQKFEYSDKVNMLGTFAHEFSHVLGLYDTYSNSTDANGYATVGPLAYDVMALGLRNGDGKYPPTYSAFERETMGWLTPTEITKGDSVYTLEDISKMQAFAVINPNASDEYYLIEYRPAVGFDSMLGKSKYSQKSGSNGALVWYIDYNAAAFATNDPNRDLNHQRVSVKSALTKNREYYADFSFVNKSGTAKVPGVFNFVFDGDSRVCFTADKSKTLDACPEEVSSSGSVAASSSDAAVSCSAIVSSSSVASSSSLNGIDGIPVTLAAKFSMRLQGGILSVAVPAPGAKRLKFFDALGNFVESVSFDGTETFIDIAKLGASGALIARLEINGGFVAAKRVVFAKNGLQT